MAEHVRFHMTSVPASGSTVSVPLLGDGGKERARRTERRRRGGPAYTRAARPHSGPLPLSAPRPISARLRPEPLGPGAGPQARRGGAESGAGSRAAPSRRPWRQSGGSRRPAGAGGGGACAARQSFRRLQARPGPPRHARRPARPALDRGRLLQNASAGSSASPPRAAYGPFPHPLLAAGIPQAGPNSF